MNSTYLLNHALGLLLQCGSIRNKFVDWIAVISKRLCHRRQGRAHSTSGHKRKRLLRKKRRGEPKHTASQTCKCKSHGCKLYPEVHSNTKHVLVFPRRETSSCILEQFDDNNPMDRQGPTSERDTQGLVAVPQIRTSHSHYISTSPRGGTFLAKARQDGTVARTGRLDSYQRGTVAQFCRTMSSRYQQQCDIARK